MLSCPPLKDHSTAQHTAHGQVTWRRPEEKKEDPKLVPSKVIESSLVKYKYKYTVLHCHCKALLLVPSERPGFSLEFSPAVSSEDALYHDVTLWSCLAWHPRSYSFVLAPS